MFVQNLVINIQIHPEVITKKEPETQNQVFEKHVPENTGSEVSDGVLDGQSSNPSTRAVLQIADTVLVNSCPSTRHFIMAAPSPFSLQSHSTPEPSSAQLRVMQWNKDYRLFT